MLFHREPGLAFGFLAGFLFGLLPKAPLLGFPGLPFGFRASEARFFFAALQFFFQLFPLGFGGLDLALRLFARFAFGRLARLSRGLFLGADFGVFFRPLFRRFAGAPGIFLELAEFFFELAAAVLRLLDLAFGRFAGLSFGFFAGLLGGFRLGAFRLFFLPEPFDGLPLEAGRFFAAFQFVFQPAALLFDLADAAFGLQAGLTLGFFAGEQFGFFLGAAFGFLAQSAFGFLAGLLLGDFPFLEFLFQMAAILLGILGLAFHFFAGAALGFFAGAMGFLFGLLQRLFQLPAAFLRLAGPFFRLFAGSRRFLFLVAAAAAAKRFFRRFRRRRDRLDDVGFRLELRGHFRADRLFFRHNGLVRRVVRRRLDGKADRSRRLRRQRGFRQWKLLLARPSLRRGLEGRDGAL